MTYRLHLLLLSLLLCQSTVIITCGVEEDNILLEFNRYRTSLNLTTLTNIDRAECVAREVAYQFKNQPCTKSIGPNTQYLELISKCHLNVTASRDVQILPACVHIMPTPVPNLDPTLVLSIFTTSLYSRYMSDTRFTGVGIWSDDNWIVVVLTTSTPHGNYSLGSNAAYSGLQMMGVDLTSVEAPEIVLTIIACIASFALFVIHPLHVIHQVWKKENSEDFYLYPYVAGIFNNVIWCMYTFSISTHSRRKELYIVSLSFSTVISLILEMVCGMAMLSFDFDSDMSKQILVALSSIGCAALYIILWLVMHYIYLGDILGFFGIISGIFMYMSPICTIHSDKSTAVLSQLGCGFMNGIALCILACISFSFDPYIAITNGIGASIQLYLIHIHFSTTCTAIVERVILFISERRSLKLWNILDLLGYVVTIGMVGFLVVSYMLPTYYH